MEPPRIEGSCLLFQWKTEGHYCDFDDKDFCYKCFHLPCICQFSKGDRHFRPTYNSDTCQYFCQKLGTNEKTLLSKHWPSGESMAGSVGHPADEAFLELRKGPSTAPIVNEIPVCGS